MAVGPVKFRPDYQTTYENTQKIRVMQRAPAPARTTYRILSIPNIKSRPDYRPT